MEVASLQLLKIRIIEQLPVVKKFVTDNVNIAICLNFLKLWSQSERNRVEKKTLNLGILGIAFYSYNI